MNPLMSHCLLHDPVFRVRDVTERWHDMNLAQVFAALATDELVSFDGLQTHQQQAWYCFLVQLAVIAIEGAGKDLLPKDADSWRALLLELSAGAQEPWCLAVSDLTKPAFLQAPIPERGFKKAKFKLDIRTPDELDVLITSKNHDVKSVRVVQASPRHWIFPLITLQTTEGFLGRGNYGVVRMNGGFASRPQVGFAPGLGWGERFRHDVASLRAARPGLIKEFGYANKGKALLWLDPWDGEKKSQIELSACDPFFIEICRRLRFTATRDELQCWRSNTSGARIYAPDDLKGITGDPWTPIDRAQSKALTLSAGGFHYRLLQEVLFGVNYQRPASMQVQPKDDGAALVASCLVRGQGKTEGLHKRVVPLTKRANAMMGKVSERQKIGSRADERVQLAATVRQKVLFPALSTLLGGGDSQRSDANKTQRWTQAFDGDVDEVFFHDLWESLEGSNDEANLAWQRRMRDLAHNRLAEAISIVPLPAMRRYRAISAAEDIFASCARKHLSELYKNDHAQEKRNVPGM